MLDSISILGLRGFATAQKLEFAKATGKQGSGLTIIVGANNAGKSTVIEALRAVIQTSVPSFTQGRRNLTAGDRVKIVVCTTEGGIVELISAEPGTSECTRTGPPPTRVFVLPSRRSFNPHFGRSESDRETYGNQVGFPAVRVSTIDQFAYRLFRAQRNRAAFDAVLARIISPLPKWSIDQQDGGQYFLKFTRGKSVHSSEGLGEGLISLLFIVDALYDSAPGDTIVIDEPELSLHPSLERRLAQLFSEYAKDRQIILATHSPYFVDLSSLANGSTIARVHLRGDGSVVSQLTTSTACTIPGLLTNENNPHILGLNAQEVFFLEDPVILVEGQEDVVFYERIESSIGIRLAGPFFGWGVGGAHNMTHIAAVLSDLGFRRVVGFLDSNKQGLVTGLRDTFPNFFFDSIPADDVRSKPEAKGRAATVGLLDDTNKAVRPEYKESLVKLFGDANAYLSAPEAA